MNAAAGASFGACAAELCGAMNLLFGWRPHEFWSATPAGVALSLQRAREATAPDRETLDALLRRFPDDERN
jgi:uncharacterized phage protein (TIGR02216 family)